MKSLAKACNPDLAVGRNFWNFREKKKNLSMEISELFTALTPEFKKESNSNSIITVFLADYIHQF